MPFVLHNFHVLGKLRVIFASKLPDAGAILFVLGKFFDG